MLDKNTINKQVMTRRTFAIGAGKFSLLFLLAGRMFYMQFIKKDDYRTLSDKNRIKMMVINPTRGEIFDVNKKLIAKNNSCFRLLLDKNGNTKFLLEVELVAEILELDNEQIKEIQKRVRRGGRRIPAIIIDCLDWQQIAVIEERHSELKSIFVDTGFERYYPTGISTAHLLGYLGRPRKKDDSSPNFIDENFKVGKNGIERYYQDVLCGKFGYKRIEVNAHGKYVRELSHNASVAGNDLHLNIDSDLQKKYYLI